MSIATLKVCGQILGSSISSMAAVMKLSSTSVVTLELELAMDSSSPDSAVDDGSMMIESKLSANETSSSLGFWSDEIVRT